MKKCAIIIGLNKTKEMPYLDAAVLGAEQMRKWAESQKYDVELITDEDHSVTHNEVFSKVDKFVAKRIYDTMLIYFAGHGFIKYPGSEIWLLSNAILSPVEAVELTLSKFYADQCGIPHVVFISDTCRVAPTNSRELAVTGGSIFCPMGSKNPRRKIDMFYSTMPGDPSFEVRTSISKNYRGVYTDCLVAGLSGEVAEIIEPVITDDEDFPAVMAYELNEYLMDEVPKQILAKGLNINQSPTGDILSRSPLYLSKFDSFALTVSPLPAISPAKKPSLSEIVKSIPALYFDDQKVQRQLNFTKNRAKYELPSEIRNMNTGFRISGVMEITGYINEGSFDIIEGDDEILVYINPFANPLSFLLVLKDGKSIPLAILKNFIGTVTFLDGILQMVSYVPSRNNQRYYDSTNVQRELDERKALVVFASRHGKFEQGKDAAKYLRSHKSYDPVLGLFAAYAYANDNRLTGINSIFRYMRREEEPVLYDVEFLHSLNKKTERHNYKAPFAPVLTKGWTYLQLNPPPRLKQLANMLHPGLWTTFTKEGTEYILKNFQFIKWQ